MKSLFESLGPTVQNWQAGRKPPHCSVEPRPAVLLSMVNYSSVSGEGDETAMKMRRKRYRAGWRTCSTDSDVKRKRHKNKSLPFRV